MPLREIITPILAKDHLGKTRSTVSKMGVFATVMCCRRLFSKITQEV